MKTLEKISGEDPTRSDDPKKAPDLKGDLRKPNGGEVERGEGEEDKTEKKEETEKIPLEEGDKRVESILEG